MLSRATYMVDNVTMPSTKVIMAPLAVSVACADECFRLPAQANNPDTVSWTQANDTALTHI